MKRFDILILFCAVFCVSVRGADPMATRYSVTECQGSFRPYPVPGRSESTPDSLTAVYISHVGRHGSRFPSSARYALTLRTALKRADSLRTITSLGKELLRVSEYVISVSDGRWGALDSLGMAEQRGIASRMVASYPELFGGSGHVKALSSYSPRAMMSMYCFLHQIDRLNNKIEFSTSTGRTNSSLLRPFDVDQDYIEFRRDDPTKSAYEDFVHQMCPLTAIQRVLGENFPYADDKEELNLALTEYYVIAGLAAMGVSYDPLKLFTIEEYNSLWSCMNMRQYLQRTATTISSVPADIAGALVMNIIQGIDEAVAGKADCVAELRFGHAETIMPLTSLLRMPGCYYLTNYFDTVALHWRDFEVVPMASNVQFILLRDSKGRHYLRTELNERPVTLIPNDKRIYIPWSEARDYMMRCVPMYMQ